MLPAIRPHGEDVTLAWLARVPAALRLRPRGGQGLHPRQPRSREGLRDRRCRGPSRRCSSLRWRGAWRALEGFMANLPRAYGSLGHAGERRWAEIGFVWCGAPGRQRLRLFRDAGAWISPGARASPASSSSRSRPRSCSSRASSCSRPISRARSACATCSARRRSCRGRCAAPTSCSRAARAAKRISGSSPRRASRCCSSTCPGFRLGERNRLLSMLLDVWFGARFELKESNWSPEKGRPFVETDGRSIYFPAVMPNRDEAVLAVLHAAGHMRFGTFDRTAMKELFARGGRRVSRSRGRCRGRRSSRATATTRCASS